MGAEIPDNGSPNSLGLAYLVNKLAYIYFLSGMGAAW